MFIDTIYFDVPVEFVTLKDGSEGLIIRKYKSNSDKKFFYKFLDPFHPSDAVDAAVDATDDITDDIAYDIIFDVLTNKPKNIVITKSNKKFYIKENKDVWVTDGLSDNTFQQMLKTNYHSNIYTLPINFRKIKT